MVHLLHKSHADAHLHGGSLSPKAFHLVIPIGPLLTQMKCPRGLEWLLQASFGIRQSSPKTVKNCRYSIAAVFVVTGCVSAIRFKKVAEILCFGVRGSSEEGLDVEDFL